MMNGNLFKFSLSALFLLVFSVCVNAQFPGADDKKQEEMPKNFKEMLEKQRINRDKKDYDEMLQRGDEALQISRQLEKSYAENKNLNAEDLKKLDRMEKLMKKIRNELGADSEDDLDDDTIIVKQENKDKNYFESLESLTGDLVDKLKNSTRFSISVAAIQTSGAVLKMVRFLKLKK